MLFRQSIMDRTHDFCPDQPGRNRMYQSWRVAKVLLWANGFGWIIWSQFCICFHRLAVIMGLTWITGLAAGFVDLEPVWYVFVGLNTLQGLFIFVAFTCNKKVLFFHLYSYINFLSWLNHECRKYFEWWRNHGYFTVVVIGVFQH